MKKKGFTLIELLAVIVILAIIALISTPIILNIISDSKEESNKRSVELYGKAVENAVAKYQLNNNESILGTFTTTDGKTLTKGEKELKVEYNGNVVCTTTEIYEDGTVYLADCTVNGGDKKYTYGKLILKPGAYDANDKLIADWDTLVSYGLNVESGGSEGVFEKEELKNVTKLVISDSVTAIGVDEFRLFNRLTSVIIPDSVTSIDLDAFEGCTNLTSATFNNPNGWKVIDLNNWDPDLGDFAKVNLDLSDPATNATYLKNTYRGYPWSRS